MLSDAVNPVISTLLSSFLVLVLSLSEEPEVEELSLSPLSVSERLASELASDVPFLKRIFKK